MPQPIEERLDTDQFIQLRIDGLSYKRIAEITGLPYQALCDYGHQVLPPDLIRIYGRSKGRAFHRRLEQLDDGTRTGAEIAAILGCTRWTVYNARKDRHAKQLSEQRDLTKCTRCECPGDPPDNPLLQTGRCFWCELQTRGVHPRTFCRTVKAQDRHLYIDLLNKLPPPDIETEVVQCQHP